LAATVRALITAPYHVMEPTSLHCRHRRRVVENTKGLLVHFERRMLDDQASRGWI